MIPPEQKPAVPGSPGESVRTLPAGAWLPLLQDALARSGRFTFPLRGTSMRPTLPAACEIEIVPLAGAPRLGELLVFVVDDVLVAHRLVGRRGEVLIAQGDNRRGPDRPLRPSQVLGRVQAAHLDGRQVWPRRGEAMRARLWLARHHVFRAARFVRRLLR